MRHALEVDGRIFLVWNDMVNGSMIVSPIERWNLANLMEATDDPWPVLSFSEVAARALGNVAGWTIAASVPPDKSTH